MAGWKRWCPILLFAALVVAPASIVRVDAQHETASDLLDGERAFRNNCANCHGPDGDLIAGIDLGRGQFRRPLTDAEIAAIIRNGIPNTAMPATKMTEAQAMQIVAYLRSLAAAKRSSIVTGDPARGQALFAGKGGCTGCHRVNGAGSRLGPDLSRIGAVRRSADLERSLLDPAADVEPSNRFYRVVTADGTTVTGRLLSHDTFTIQMLDATEQLRSFQKADLREHGFAATPMPSVRGRLLPQEIADLVSYLASLRN